MKTNPLLCTLCCIAALPAAAAWATVVAWPLNSLPVAFRATVTAVPEMSAFFFPVVGLIAAVSFTQILRRRRMAQKTASIG